MLVSNKIDEMDKKMSAGIKQKCFVALHVIAAVIALFYLLLIAGFAHAAVPSLELFAVSGNTTVTGPITASQAQTYYLNANNPNDNNTATFTPTTTVTLGLNNQQFTSGNNTTTGAPGGNAMMFGGEGNSDGDSVVAATIFVPLSTKGNPSASVFTATSNTPAGQGISVSANYGSRFFVSTEPLQRANLSRSGRHYMGDIVVTFNRPIVEPVIHVAGLGGTASSGLGFSAEFDLQTQGYTLSQLSGSSELTVNSTQILNNSANMGATTGSGGASGSVVVKGGAVSTLTFRVYMHGDGTGNAWDSAGTQNGDAFVFSAGSMDASVDLSAVKTQRVGVTGTFTANDTTIAVGSPIQYQLVLTNNGPQYVTNATFSDILPSALTTPTIISNSNTTTCPSPSFSGNTLSGTLTGSVGATCTIVIQATGGSNADITNTVSVAPPSSINDLNTSNDSDSVKTRIGTGSPSTDVVVGKTDGLDSIAQGASNTYTLRVVNNGANPVTGAILKDPATSGLTKTGTPTCTSASGNSCTASSTNALLESTGIILPTLAANGGFYEITIKATVGNVTSITNTATVDVGANYDNSGTSCTTNNGITRNFSNGLCNSTDTTTVIANGSLSFDSAIREARLGISPNIPTIWRGGGGQQTITITNNGPDTANNVFATYTESLQTGVGVGSVTLSNGTACTVSGTSPRVWRCPLGTLANGSTANFLVNYTTTTASTLGNGQTEGIVRAGSDELNPGSGVGESAYRIWGSETQQRTNPSKYGAFMVGYNGSGGNVTGSGNGNFGPYSYEGSSIEAAWPANQASPTGGYLNNGIAGTNSSNYLASSSTNAATVQRLLTTLTNIQVSLPREDTASNLTDNRRAWELKTGALIPTGTSQNVTLCIGTTGQFLDDSAYVMVNGVRQGTARDTYAGSIYTVPITLNAGYNVITYRIANRNSTSGDGGEVNAGGFSTIGLSSGTDCLPAQLNTLINQGEPAKINIIDAAALVITKTNSTNLINSNGQTTYSITVENQGPSDVSGAILKDPVSNNMTKGTPVCSTITNNQCTAATTPTAAQLQGASGFALPKLSSGQKYVLNVPVTFSADNVTSVTNTASVQTPAGLTALATACVNDTTNGYTRTYDADSRTCTTSDTDSTRAHVRIVKNSAGGTGSFSFTLTNTSVTDETVTTTTAGTAVTGTVVHDVDDPALEMKITENAATGYVLTSASCVDNNAAKSGNPATAIGTLSGSTITIPASNLKAGADLRCSFANSKLPTITLNKIANGANDTFGFTLTNTSVTGGSVTTTTPATATPVDSDTNTAGNQDFSVSALNQNVTIQESTLPPSWKLSSAQCTNAGNTVVGTLDVATRTYTVPAAQVTAGAAFNCTFTNTKQRNLTLKKTWVNAKLNDAATVTATGLTSFNAVADTANETDPATPQAVDVGTTITLGETITTGAGNYNAVLSCIRDSDSSVVTVNASNQVTMPDAAVSCTYTNTRKSTTFRLAKVWGANSTAGNVANIGATTGLINNTAAFTSTASTTTNGTAVTVYAGETATLPQETMSTGTLANYNTALSCDAGTLSGTNGQNTGNTLTIPAAATSTNPITCTYTNTPKTATLQLSKTWGANSPATDSATIGATTGGSANTAAFTTTGGTNANSGVVTVTVGNTITFPAETGTNIANYSSGFSCLAGGGATANSVNGNNGQASSTLLIGAGDAGKAIVCTYNNTRKTANITLRKAWSGAASNDSATVNLKRGATTVDSLSSTSTGNNTDIDSTPFAAFVGETLNLSEVLGGSNTGQYTASLACDNGVTVAGNGDFTVPATATNCTVTNTRKTRTVTLTKALSPTTDSGKFNLLVNGTAVATNIGHGGSGNVVVPVGSSVSISETAGTVTTLGSYSTTYSCNTSPATTGSSTSGSFTQPDADVACTFTNTRKSATLTIVKQWQNGKSGDAISIPATTGLSNNTAVLTSTATVAGNYATNGTSVIAYAGETATLGTETFTTGSAANYNTTLSCSGAADTNLTDGLTISAADTAITCTYTNSRIAQQLNVAKQWQNAVNGHTATVATTGGTNNATFNSTSTGNTSTTGTAVTVYAGDVVTLPAETFGGGANAAQYNSTLACSGGTPLSSGAVNRSITISGSTTATVCTYTNARKSATLTLRKTWSNAKVNDAVTVTATGLTSLASVADTASETDTGTAQTVYVGDSITLSEAFTTGTASNYNSGLACTGTSGLSGSTLTVGNTDTAITCIYTNVRKSATLTLSKTWAANSITGDTVTVTSSGFANNATSGTSTATAAGNTTTGTSVNVYAGETGSIIEAFGTGSAANYNATLACSGNSNAISGNSLTIGNNDTAINCAYTNTVKQADLVIDKVAPATVTQGSSLSYTIKVWNKGPSAVSNSTVTDTVPASLTGVTWTCAASGSANCGAATNGSGNNISVTTGSLPVNSSNTAPTSGSYLTFNVTATASSVGSVTNTATVGNPVGAVESNNGNNSSSATTNVIASTVVISGRVFEDNSGTTNVVANAYNGTQQAGEIGLGKVSVRLTNCASTTLATTQTDANGDYSFSIGAGSLSAPNFCLVETNLADYTSVSGSGTYDRATDIITLRNTGATSYSNNNFGDAKLALVLTEQGQQTVIAGGVVDYPHRIVSSSVLDLTALNKTANQQPANANDQAWESLLYRDTNCNGKVDAGEALLANSLPLTILPLSTQQVCVVQRVRAPVNASSEAQYVSQLQASYKATLADSSVISRTSNIVTDTTLTGSAGLDLQKRVRVVASCPSTAADTNPFVTSNQASNKNFLEYEITYRNNSVKNLIDVSLKDSVPTGTVFQNVSCNVNPVSCTATHNSGALTWQMTGSLLSNKQGTVRFCVAVP